MAKDTNWVSEDGVALREFLRKVPAEKISSVMGRQCPATIDSEIILKSNADAIARLAAMKAGWEAYEKALFGLSEIQQRPNPDPGFQDMT
ncbi:MAG: hypothetical protein M0Q93_00495 [Terrimicrobiaceae bacterium]|jgi:hypothetical protein|nr:hypothetical protein [Terrimicrobiaceae bacterium]